MLVGTVLVRPLENSVILPINPTTGESSLMETLMNLTPVSEPLNPHDRTAVNSKLTMYCDTVDVTQRVAYGTEEELVAAVTKQIRAQLAAHRDAVEANDVYGLLPDSREQMERVGFANSFMI